MARRVGGVMTVADPSSNDTSCGAKKAHSCGWGGWGLFFWWGLMGVGLLGGRGIDNQQSETKPRMSVKIRRAQRLLQTIKMYIIFIIYI